MPREAVNFCTHSLREVLCEKNPRSFCKPSETEHMTSSITKISNFQFYTSFASYAFCPTLLQQKKHSGSMRAMAGWIIKDIIGHIISHLICSYYILRCNTIISIILSILLYLYHLIDFLGNLFLLRDLIIFDLRRFMRYHPSQDIPIRQYSDLYHSLTQYTSYLRYYHFNQDESRDCANCMDTFDNITYNNQSLLICGHKFHQNCLEKFENKLIESGRKFRCPMCNKNYVVSKHKYKFNPKFYGKKMLYTQLPRYIKIPHDIFTDIRECIINFVASLPLYSL